MSTCQTCGMGLVQNSGETLAQSTPCKPSIIWRSRIGRSRKKTVRRHANASGRIGDRMRPVELVQFGHANEEQADQGKAARCIERFQSQ